MSIVYRPLSLQELAPLVESPECLKLEDLEEIVKLCGSFLILREGIIYFLHQSAKDYLLRNAANTIFLSGMRGGHYTICQRSLKLMSQILRRDIYNMDNWGIPPTQITPPDPDPLAAVRYSCVYWANHLAECQPNEQIQNNSLQDDGIVYRFLREHYLHWLEALSIIESLPQGVLAISKLKELVLVGCNHEIYMKYYLTIWDRENPRNLASLSTTHTGLSDITCWRSRAVHCRYMRRRFFLPLARV